MSRLTILFLILVCAAHSGKLVAGDVLAPFKISTESVDAYNYAQSSLKLEANSRTYSVMLEPIMDGSVMFSLGRHAYTSTLRINGLAFGVKIEGFKDGLPVHPILNLDDTYQNIVIDDNFIKFQWLNGPIPVMFNSPVDSIKLNFSNSHSLKLPQYFSIDDLQVVSAEKIIKNPLVLDCEKQSIMIGIEGSSSIDKAERKSIAKQLMRLSKDPLEELDSNAVCIMEFGKQVYHVSESVEKKGINKSIKSYKKSKEAPKKPTGFTNWSAAFDQAIERRPDVFIFITDRWSNYTNSGPASFNSQYQELVDKCNKIKSNGTHLLFITSGLNKQGRSNISLHSMLSENQTREINGVEITDQLNLKDVDLISMQGFDALERIDLSSLLHCGETGDLVLKPLSEEGFENRDSQEASLR